MSQASSSKRAFSLTGLFVVVAAAAIPLAIRSANMRPHSAMTVHLQGSTAAQRDSLRESLADLESVKRIDLTESRLTILFRLDDVGDQNIERVLESVSASGIEWTRFSTTLNAAKIRQKQDE